MNTVKLLATLTGVILLCCMTAAGVRSAEPPLIVSAVAPVYPPAAKASRVTGEVFVDVVMNRDGQVTSAEAVGAHKMLEKAVVEAARQWKFVPGPRGQAERMARLTFSFMIQPQGAAVSEGTPVFYPREYKVEVRSLEYVVH